MEIIKEVLTKYWYLAASIITLIGILKFAIHASSRGLRAAISQLIAFVLVVTVLVTLAGPFLNWTFASIVESIRDNLIAQSGYELTSQTIDLIKNADVSDGPLSIDQEIIDKAKAENAESSSSGGSGSSSVEPTKAVGPTQVPLQTPIVMPTEGPQATSTPVAAVTRKANGEPLVTVIPTKVQNYEPLVTVVPTKRQNFEPLVTVVPRMQSGEPLVTVIPTLAPMPTEAPIPTLAPMPTEEPLGGGPQVTYTVQKGDSLAKIANKFGVSTNQICLINNIRNCNIIHVNMVLVIP